MTARPQSYTRALTTWAKLWRTPSLPGRVAISFSPRLRTSLGRTRPQSGRITLHARLASAPRAVLLEILCHEAAHVAARLRYGPHAKPHGPEWRALVTAAGYQPATALHLPRLGAAPSRPRAPGVRHHYRCPVCQADYWRRRPNARLACSVCHQSGLTVLLRHCAPSLPRP